MPLDLPVNYATEKLPPVSEELIIWLKAVYPDRLPDVEDDIESIRIKQGQQQVVRTLISVREETENVFGSQAT